MSEALKMPMLRGSIQELGEAIAKARDEGIPLSRIAEATGVNRALVSSLCNHGVATISEERQALLWDWVAQRESELGNSAPETRQMRMPGISARQEIELIPTRSYTEGLGMCKFAQENRGIAIITGKPGTGKTTIVNTLQSVLPHPICIEAWPMMRLGDLLNDIAEGIGIRLSGTQVQKVRQIERALKGTDITLVIDEAEMLRKWDNDKLEVLRKIWDHTGISLIMFGTPLLHSIVSRMNTTQLSRRMWSVQLRGATAKEVRDALGDYNITDEAADELARIAADTDRGGMGTWAMIMRLCLKFAGGGAITRELVTEAKQYKPGL